MAIPVCPKCDSHVFSLQSYDPPGTMYKIEILCCSFCGAVVGTIGYPLTVDRIDQIYRAIGKILQKLGM